MVKAMSLTNQKFLLYPFTEGCIGIKQDGGKGVRAELLLREPLPDTTCAKDFGPPESRKAECDSTCLPLRGTL